MSYGMDENEKKTIPTIQYVISKTFMNEIAAKFNSEPS